MSAGAGITVACMAPAAPYAQRAAREYLDAYAAQDGRRYAVAVLELESAGN